MLLCTWRCLADSKRCDAYNINKISSNMLSQIIQNGRRDFVKSLGNSGAKVMKFILMTVKLEGVLWVSLTFQRAKAGGFIVENANNT